MERSNYICPACGGELIYEKYKETHMWICTDCQLMAFEYDGMDSIVRISERLEYGIQERFNWDE